MAQRPQPCKICQNMYVFPSRWKFRTDFHVLPSVTSYQTERPR